MHVLNNSTRADLSLFSTGSIINYNSEKLQLVTKDCEKYMVVNTLPQIQEGKIH